MSLITLMLVKAWVLPLLYLDFEIRRDYIVANLCVNRDKPILLCNGKCYLTKRVKDAREKEERQAENDYLSHLLYQVMDNRTLVFNALQNPFELRSFVQYQFNPSLTARNPASDIFHPPLV
ncbi:hypothetical protein Dfri01_38790 [Dyadobacter frigoris]|nr:hypothetical protein Dfri01_38790 [Dyadobacter frigoris]